MKASKYLLTVLVLTTSIAKAAPSVVTTAQCQQVANKAPFILVLKEGQPLVESIIHCANNAQLKGASLSGIGQIQKPTLAYYNLTTKRYQYKNYNGIYHLVSLNGNITLLNNKPKAYLQAAISNEQFTVMGGYLNEAFTAGSVEIMFIPLTGSLIRKHDAMTGLNLLKPDKK